MILFESDWLEYPNAVIHYETSNKSALYLAAKLRMMGIKNNAFFLALHDPRLKDVNPHSPDLTIEQMGLIGAECRVNPWYVLREVFRAPAIVGNETVPVEVNRANIALWWCFFNHVTFILTQPRQTGKSFCTDLLMTTLMNFLCNNTQINLMTKDDKLRAENIRRLKKIYEELPTYLQFKDRSDANNTESITINAFKNVYNTHVPQASEKRAYNLGRGMTSPIFQIDEAPFQVNIGIAMGAALMAMAAAEERAKQLGEPYGVILTTTAGKIDDKDGGYVYDWVQKAATFSEKMYDCKDHAELEAFVRSNCRGGNFRVYGAFSYRQLGKDDAWMRQQLERSGITGDDANRDLFNCWTTGSNQAVLPTNIINAMVASMMDPVYEQIQKIGGYVIRWYVEENELHDYLKNNDVVVGVDTSDASGSDDIGLVFTDVKTGRVVGAGNYNVTNLITFSMWLVDLICSMPRTTWIIERRSSGVTIIDYLLLQLPLRNVDPFKRIFNLVVNNHYEHKDRYAEAQQTLTRRAEDLYVRCKRQFGFATSGSGMTSRTELYSTTLNTAARLGKDRMADRSLVQQVITLENRNGRIDHAVGGHDDMVIGWLLTYWFLTKGENLGHYGLDPKDILRDCQPEPSKQLTPQEQAQRILQAGIRERIDTLAELMKSEPNEWMLERYKNELVALNSRLVLEEGETFSLYAFLDEIKEARRKSGSIQTITNYGGAYSGITSGHYQNEFAHHASRQSGNIRAVW